MTRREDLWGPKFAEHDDKEMHKLVHSLQKLYVEKKEDWLRKELSRLLPALGMQALEDRKPRTAKIITWIFGVKILNIYFEETGIEAFVILKRGAVVAGRLFLNPLHFT